MCGRGGEAWGLASGLVLFPEVCGEGLGQVL